MVIISMKRNIKKIGCWIVMLIIIAPPILLIAYVLFHCSQDRDFVKIDGYKTITIWHNYIIFDRYWYPFYPKKNYIYVDNHIEEFYDISFTITQDSIIGIWCTQPIKECRVDNIKGSDEYIGFKERADWERQYDFACVTEERKDSLQFEFGFTLWYPCCMSRSMYIYRSEDAFVEKEFEYQIFYY